MSIKKKIKISLLALLIFASSFLSLSTNNYFTFFNEIEVSASTATLDKVDYSKDIIYQIVTDRFYDGNTSNNPTGELYDSTKTNLKKYLGGDWQGIINKINDGYFTNMGVTALWISQPVENIYSVLSTSGTSYHGYWARDFKKTNPAFGSFTDFQNLIDTAHAKGIKIIIDFAPNHTSPAGELEPNYAENGKLYNNGTLLGGYTNDTKNLFHHNGGTDFSTIEDGIYRNLYDLADLNHQNATVDSYLKDAIKLWLDKGIDGIRVDAVKHMSFGWQKSFMDTVYSHKPVFTFGEWFLGVGELDSNNTDFANNYGMSLLDFRFGQTVRQVLRDGTGTMYTLDSMFKSTASDYESVNDQVTFIDNHDMERFSTGNNQRAVDQALVLTLTSRGVPAIYYGTEQYMTGGNDPDNRAMMTSFNTNTNAYQIIKSLSSLRKTNSAISYGTTAEKWINNDVYIYERKFENNVVVVAINKGSSATNVSGLNTSLPSGSYSDVLSKRLSGNDVSVTNGSVTTFSLAGKSAAVWSYVASPTQPTIGNIVHPMAKAGQQVSIVGSGFGSSKGKVYFGTTEATVTSWNDKKVSVTVPAINAGKVSVYLKTSSGVSSNKFNNYDIVSGNLVTVRFVVNNASTTLGQNVYLVGSIPELGSWDTSKGVGAMYNQVMYKYPTWYYDVSVPAGTTIEYKFIKKSGSTVTWESGNNHTYTVPQNTTGTVTVNWQN